MYMVYNEVLLHKMDEFESTLSCLIRAIQPTDYKKTCRLVSPVCRINNTDQLNIKFLNL